MPATGTKKKAAFSRAGVIWWTLVLLYIAGIVIAAVRPEFSGAATTRLIQKLFPSFPLPLVESLAYLIRKAIHFLGYAVFAVFLFNAMLSTITRPLTRGKRAQAMIYAVVLALMGAVLDETLQMHFPARSGRLQDVAIDLMGIIAGVTARSRLSRRNLT